METIQKKRVGMNLTEGPILKLLLAFAVPIVLTNLIQQLYSMVDLVIIGQYVGSIGTVGVSTGGELSDIMTPIATAFASAGQVYIAQLMGAKNEKRVKETVGTLISLMTAVAIVCMLLVIFFCDEILGMLNCPQEAFAQAKAYMIITAVGMPFIFGYNAICGILRGMGESKRPLLFIIVAAVVNIFMDILLVAVFRMEAAGTAIATVLAQLGSFAAAFIYMYKRREQFDFELRLSYFRIRKEPLKIILMLGIPQFVRVSLVRFSMLWVNANINAFGLTVSATNSIGNKIYKFLEVFTQGVDNAAGAMIGQNLGAKKQDRARRVVWVTLGCTLCIAAVTIPMVLLMPRMLFGAFTSDTAVIEFGVTYLRILAVAIFVSSVISPFNAMVSGSGFVSLGFAIGILDGVVCRIGFSLLFAYGLGMGALGYFWATACCRVLPCLLCFAYFASGKWRTRKLLSER